MTRALLDPPVFAALEDVGYTTRLLTADVVSVTLGGAECRNPATRAQRITSSSMRSKERRWPGS